MLTPLHLACWYGQESVVKLLLEHGADVNATDKVSLIILLSSHLLMILCQEKHNANASVWFHVPKSIVYSTTTVTVIYPDQRYFYNDNSTSYYNLARVGFWFLPGAAADSVMATFSRFGVPDSLVTDNEPCFGSSERPKFVDQWNFQDITDRPVTRILCGVGGANEAKVDQTTTMYF